MLVAPHDGCVDWNSTTWREHLVHISRTPRWVRGLKCSFWNTLLWCSPCVAPHDGCVDWNNDTVSTNNEIKQSHPTMGAWIEICPRSTQYITFKGRTPRWVRGLKSKECLLILLHFHVAPHDGCVDWNLLSNPSFLVLRVAPHDGCVDWNRTSGISANSYMGRTPRWVRGLKFF